MIHVVQIKKVFKLRDKIEEKFHVNNHNGITDSVSQNTGGIELE